MKTTLGSSSRTIFRRILTGSSQDAVKPGCTKVSLKKYFFGGGNFYPPKKLNPVYALTWQLEEPVRTSQDVLNMLFKTLSGCPVKRIFFGVGTLCTLWIEEPILRHPKEFFEDVLGRPVKTRIKMDLGRGGGEQLENSCTSKNMWGINKQTKRNMGELRRIPAVSFQLAIWLH